MAFYLTLRQSRSWKTLVWRSGESRPSDRRRASYSILYPHPNQRLFRPLAAMVPVLEPATALALALRTVVAKAMLLEPQAHLQTTSWMEKVMTMMHMLGKQLRSYCRPQDNSSLLSKKQEVKEISIRTQTGVRSTGKEVMKGKATRTKSIRLMRCPAALRRKLRCDVNAALVRPGQRGAVHHELLLGHGVRAHELFPDRTSGAERTRWHMLQGK
ncbi:hypothetical protein BU26DRAFT_77785 [Trematosphaeria pertusa]|uniref:Uncharacterized protein n=1 Tax=Trematosphaeria pertusa TaxID=390896 RepID=A0A6A6I4E1_9PLEO|nr:uncharacterized protein BU26DRAFT_77785 [Trematosphaeria pertusa]KAF2245166.1 hypothetical protein BU26DRAFT_77785 [Trematosphaeria pertusa]